MRPAPWREKLEKTGNGSSRFWFPFGGSKTSKTVSRNSLKITGTVLVAPVVSPLNIGGNGGVGTVGEFCAFFFLEESP